MSGGELQGFILSKAKGVSANSLRLLLETLIQPHLEEKERSKKASDSWTNSPASGGRALCRHHPARQQCLHRVQDREVAQRRQRLARDQGGVPDIAPQRAWQRPPLLGLRKNVRAGAGQVTLHRDLRDRARNASGASSPSSAKSFDSSCTSCRPRSPNATQNHQPAPHAHASVGAVQFLYDWTAIARYYCERSVAAYLHPCVVLGGSQPRLTHRVSSSTST